MKTSILIFFVTGLAMASLCCCSTHNELKSEAIDSTRIIEFGIDYLYKTHRYSDAYYDLPIQIIKSENVPQNLRFQMSGKYCEVVNRPDREKYYITPPLPYIDIKRLEMLVDGVVELEIHMPTIGSIYVLTIKPDATKALKVTNVLISKS